jgi:hypothetical protein
MVQTRSQTGTSVPDHSDAPGIRKSTAPTVVAKLRLSIAGLKARLHEASNIDRTDHLRKEIAGLQTSLEEAERFREDDERRHYEERDRLREVIRQNEDTIQEQGARTRAQASNAPTMSADEANKAAAAEYQKKMIILQYTERRLQELITLLEMHLLPNVSSDGQDASARAELDMARLKLEHVVGSLFEVRRLLIMVEAGKETMRRVAKDAHDRKERATMHMAVAKANAEASQFEHARRQYIAMENGFNMMPCTPAPIPSIPPLQSLDNALAGMNLLQMFDDDC